MSSAVETKRKREDGTEQDGEGEGKLSADREEELNDAKKPKLELEVVSSAPAAAATAAPAADIFEQVPGTGATTLVGTGKGTQDDPHVILIGPDKVGHVIGSKGAVIAEMQKITGAKIYVDQVNVAPGQPRKVNITGTPEQVEKAVALVSKVVTHGPTSIHANAMLGGPSVPNSTGIAFPIVRGCAFPIVRVRPHPFHSGGPQSSPCACRPLARRDDAIRMFGLEGQAQASTRIGDQRGPFRRDHAIQKTQQCLRLNFVVKHVAR